MATSSGSKIALFSHIPCPKTDMRPAVLPEDEKLCRWCGDDPDEDEVDALYDDDEITFADPDVAVLVGDRVTQEWLALNF
jgi:hypothetical protein